MAKNKVGVHGTDAETGRGGKAEKECPITREEFDTAQDALKLSETLLSKKTFATGTLGYFGQISAIVTINGKPVKLTGNAQLYVPHSKDAK